MYAFTHKTQRPSSPCSYIYYMYHMSYIYWLCWIIIRQLDNCIPLKIISFSNICYEIQDIWWANMRRYRRAHGSINDWISSKTRRIHKNQYWTNMLARQTTFTDKWRVLDLFIAVCLRDSVVRRIAWIDCHCRCGFKIFERDKTNKLYSSFCKSNWHQYRPW